jgi:hypothetical protein
MEAFRRVHWIVLDGMGIQHVRLLLASGGFPGLERIAREGILTGCEPSSPACQTPPALLSLFSGASPRESGVWGYLMPDPVRPLRSISGFAARAKPVRPIWEDMESRGMRYSLMNVAFRNDSVWRGGPGGLDFGYDGYRLSRKPELYAVGGRETPARFQGIEVGLRRARGSVTMRKGSRVIATLHPGEARVVSLTAVTRAYATLLDTSHLCLAPLTIPLVRGPFRPLSTAEDFIDFNLFRAVRRLNREREERALIPVCVEMGPAETGMKQKEALMMDAIRGTSSRLVAGYFPVVDELNHARFDLLDAPSPDARTRDLFLACGRLVDGLVSRVMAECDEKMLVVLSSDHGVSAFRGTLHINELFARCGLVSRRGEGYDLERSFACYHPSDCGIVLSGRSAPAAFGGADRRAALRGIHAVVERAQKELGVRIGIEEAGPDDPFIAFLYPVSDICLTARRPRRGEGMMDRTRSGGQHVSALSGSPWMQAMLGMWTPRSAALSRELDGVPTENRMMKSFLLRMLEGD